MPSQPSPSPRRSASWWNDVSGQFEQYFGVVMLVAGATAVLLVVSFIGVLQGAVQRGELRQAQMRLAASTKQSAAPVVVVSGRTMVVAARSGQ